MELAEILYDLSVSLDFDCHEYRELRGEVIALLAEDLQDIGETLSDCLEIIAMEYKLTKMCKLKDLLIGDDKDAKQ